MRFTLFVIISLLAQLALPGPSFAEESSKIELPDPHTQGGMPLMQALKERQSTREFSSRPLSQEVLSDLLWAAFGINRPDSGKRTAPSARNWQEMDIYVVQEDRSYVYHPRNHSLEVAAEGDLRDHTGRQDFAAKAPLNLVLVADTTRMTGVSEEDIGFYKGADAGFISQNIYLFCASEGLATVVRANINRDLLGKALNLEENQRIVLAQSVGYFKD